MAKATLNRMHVYLSLSRFEIMIYLASPTNPRRGFAISPMLKAYFCGLLQMTWTAPAVCLAQRCDYRFHEGLGRQCSLEALGKWSNSCKVDSHGGLQSRINTHNFLSKSHIQIQILRQSPLRSNEHSESGQYYYYYMIKYLA